jgi:hypothetical protein
MRVADKRSGIDRGDLVAVAETFGVRNPSGVVDQVRDVLARWPVYAEEQGVPDDTIRRVGSELEERHRSLGELLPGRSGVLRSPS